MGIADLVAIAACLAADLGPASLDDYIDEVNVRTEFSIGGIGYCSCEDPSVLEAHSRHHVRMATQFLYAAAARVVAGQKSGGFEVSYLCCDPTGVATVLAVNALTVASEHTGRSVEETTHLIRAPLAA